MAWQLAVSGLTIKTPLARTVIFKWSDIDKVEYINPETTQEILGEGVRSQFQLREDQDIGGYIRLLRTRSPMYRYPPLAFHQSTSYSIWMNRKYLISLLVIISCLFPTRLSAQNLIINSNDVMPRSSADGSGYEDRILKEAFRRVGATFDRITVPSARALILANQGAIDGDYVRIQGIDSSFPDLVRVDVPIATMDFSAFTVSPGPYPVSWADLASVPFAHIIGWKIVEQNTAGFGSAQKVRDPEALFAMLSSGKVRTVVYDRSEGLRYLRNLVQGMDPDSIRVTSLEQRGMYLYLNARHKDLAGRLEAALSDMEQEGLIASITAEVEGGL
ncbi:MAG: hypothetical protein RBT68_08555 [Spirochaetia bacterium]|nr:hypothetical protein [Spirochaetia bacterium]